MDLEDHTLRPFIEAAMAKARKGSKVVRIKPVDYSDPGDFWSYTLNFEGEDVRHRRYSPVSFEVIDRGGALTGYMGVSFYREKTGRLNLVFSSNIMYCVYDSAEKYCHVPQSLQMDLTVPVEDFFGHEGGKNVQLGIRKILEENATSHAMAEFAFDNFKVRTTQHSDHESKYSFPGLDNLIFDKAIKEYLLIMNTGFFQ